MHDPTPSKESAPTTPMNGLWQRAYIRYHQFWIRLACTGGVSRDEAEEMVHAVVVAAMDDEGRAFESEEHIRNYVAKAVLNRAIERRRLLRRVLPMTDDLDERLSGVAAAEQDHTDNMQEVLRIGVRELPPNLYQVVKLRFFCGFTFREVSDILGLPISTLKSREEAALQRMRKTMRRHGC